MSSITKRMLAFVAVVNTFLLQFLGYLVFENSLCSCLMSLSINGTKTGNWYMLFLLCIQNVFLMWILNHQVCIYFLAARLDLTEERVNDRNCNKQIRYESPRILNTKNICIKEFASPHLGAPLELRDGKTDNLVTRS